SIMGFAIAAILLLQREPAPLQAAEKPREQGSAEVSWRLLLSAPILINFVFFMLLAISNFGLQNFSVVALGALYGTTPATANAALSANLALSAIGVLLGGWIATRISHHGLAAVIGLLLTTLAVALVGTVDLGSVLLIVVMSLSGLFTGAVMPSRDM